MIRMRSLSLSPPHGWIALPPIVAKPIRAWSFDELCLEVQLEHPEWDKEHTRRTVEKHNAERLQKLPDWNQWITVDFVPEQAPDLSKLATDNTRQLAETGDLLLVLPVCSREIPLLVKLLDWMLELDPEFKPDALLTYDFGIDRAQLRRVKPLMVRLCRHWDQLTYPVPPPMYFAPNWAFQCTARYIAGTLKRPWLWFEADMTPVKPGWFNRLQEEYQKAKKPCMGVLVPGMGHMNGTGIYPADYANWAHNAMKAHTSAWDMEQIRDMGGQVHEASYLMQHVWGIIGNKTHPSQGVAPVFRSQADLANWLNPNAITFHRCKDGTLIDQLRKRQA